MACREKDNQIPLYLQCTVNINYIVWFFLFWLEDLNRVYLKSMYWNYYYFFFCFNDFKLKSQMNAMGKRIW